MNPKEMTGILRAARALLHIDQDELAKRAGVSRAVISRIENDDETVNLKQIKTVQAALERSGVHFLDSPKEHGLGLAFGLKRASKQ